MSIEDYKIIKEVGRGAYGVVFEAVNKDTGEKVAMKRLDISDVDDMSQIRTEIQLLKNMCNIHKEQGKPCQKHMSSFIDTVLDGDYLYIISGFIDGIGLEKVKFRKYNNCNEAILHTMRLITQSLKFVHSLDIVHRDIKPENILLTKDDAILIDFGLSCMMQPLNKNIEKCYPEVQGTPLYIPPEIWKNTAKLSELMKVDIFSLGAVFYEMAVGKTLFDGKNPYSIALNIMKDKHEKIDTGDRTLDELIEVMIDPKPGDRPTASEVLRVLNTIDDPEFEVCR